MRPPAVAPGRFRTPGTSRHFEHLLHNDVMAVSSFPDPQRLWGPDAYDHLRQDILNELPIPPRSWQHDCWIAVTARLVWELDGLELVDTYAFAWFGRKVLVEVRDGKHRRGSVGVWLHASDVRRR